MSANAHTLPEGTKIPNHIAIIPDGNRRWARARGLEPSEGHKQGAKRVSELIREARKLGVHTLTFWGLSTENWQERPKKEVATLVKIIRNLIDENLKEAQKEGARIIHIGRKDRLPKILLDKIRHAEEKTKNNTKFILNLALDYGGQDEIVRAIQKIVAKGYKAEEIDKELIDIYMDTADQPYPYPDLLIRTSGEQRTSGLLIWQSGYTEYYWEQDHLPDMSLDKLKAAILDYSCRRRRFGGNDAVVRSFKFKPEVSAKLELSWWRLSKIPEGTRFVDFARGYLKEQWGLSKELTHDAAKLMIEAFIEGKSNKWPKARMKLGKFYKLIKDHAALALEPSVAASLEVSLWQKINGGSRELSHTEIEDTTRRYITEVYRISDLQAQKAAHLRALATTERNKAERGGGEQHWQKAEEYLELYYRALKDRIA